jgi:hypothetical protein
MSAKTAPTLIQQFSDLFNAYKRSLGDYHDAKLGGDSARAAGVCDESLEALRCFCRDVGMLMRPPRPPRRVVHRSQPGYDQDAYDAHCEAVQEFGNDAGAWLAERAEQPKGEQPRPAVCHSEDFRGARWYGTDYTFTPYQAACVKVLWAAWESGSPVLSQSTILDRAGSDGSKLRDVFDKGKHPAWETMIVAAERKGAYRLAEPAARPL